jgi:outer membrane protein
MKKSFIIILLSAIAFSGFAQTNVTALQYSVGFGVGNMHDFISPASFRGFTVDYRHLVRPNLGVGIDIGWNVFYDEIPDDIYEYKNLTYSGKQWRYSNEFPMLAAVDYYVNKNDKIIPFAGFGLGTMYSLQNTDMSVYTFEKDAWHFAIRPEIGLIYKAAPGVGVMLASKYYYGFKAGDLESQGYLTVNFGFVFVP